MIERLSEFFTYSEDETYMLGERFGKELIPGDVICLNGDLGVGKTAFTKGIANALEVSEYITSPTYTIVNEYQGKLPFNHFDVYRISDSSELFEIGFEEYLQNGGVTVIEWAELIKDAIPESAIFVTISKDLDKGLDARKIVVERYV